nr:DapH/DapD/GlmU-related protein [Lacticigenium naphthae]
MGAGATVVPGVTIGENSVVRAGSIVTKDVLENSVVAGVPAKVIRMIEE